MTYVSQQALFKIIVLKSFLGLKLFFYHFQFHKNSQSFKVLWLFSVRQQIISCLQGSLKSA